MSSSFSSDSVRDWFKQYPIDRVFVVDDTLQMPAFERVRRRSGVMTS
jgi:hypothetical protein